MLTSTQSAKLAAVACLSRGRVAPPALRLTGRCCLQLTPFIAPLPLPQSALFALAVADIVLVNMWAKDIGRETGAGKPLLKTIFQVNLKLFQVRRPA